MPNRLRQVNITVNYLEHAEGAPFSQNQLHKLFVLAKGGVWQLIDVQKKVLKVGGR